MATSFVLRGLALYKRMDVETKNIYKKLMDLPSDAGIVDLEKALTKYEYQKNNSHELLLDMEAELEE